MTKSLVDLNSFFIMKRADMGVSHPMGLREEVFLAQHKCIVLREKLIAARILSWQSASMTDYDSLTAMEETSQDVENIKVAIFHAKEELKQLEKDLEADEVPH